MAPRKRTNSASKKSSSNHNNQHQQSQPSKFGIQHFFERHTQNQSQNSKKLPQCINSDSTTTALHSQNPQFAPEVRNHSHTSPRNDAVNAERANSKDSVSADQNTGDQSVLKGRRAKNANLSCETENSRDDLELGVNHVEELENGGNLKVKKLNNPSQITPTENQLPVALHMDENQGEDQVEVSPEVCKGNPAKRFKFSPGMLIKQSQDDGAEEITWRISPVNERLHAMSKHFPEMVKVLAESSRFNCTNFKQCSQRKSSSGEAGKLEKWLSSPPLETGENSSKHLDIVHLTKLDIKDNVSSSENSRSRNSKNGSQSPFMTPPSLSYCHEKPADNEGDRVVPYQLGLRPHKKALIELLDQVEDVISVEESVCDETEACIEVEKSENSASALMSPVINSKDIVNNEVSSNLYFLVLEVSEKHGCLDSFGSQSLCKIMRLLNEQTGEERIVQLWDEWLYSVVGPGDTVHIIGEFDSLGKCDVNRDKNFLIVHPDILVSGTRVAASFGCSRRAVLDERLKRSEYSAAAVIGTLLHQIFQAGLIRESLSKEFLEEYARVVLQKNLETIYACGVNENDTLKTLTDAIPKILNWISMFKNSQGSKTRGIEFGCDGGAKKLNISEVIDIEEMIWAPRFGLKGMIDASMHVKVEVDNQKATMKVMPFEFKTGRGTTGQNAVEHSAQVMLYTLLMSERYGQNIDHGLLYYLHTDHTQGIAVRRSDLVGLIIRRNELANDLFKASMYQQLPPMLQSLNMCRSCRHLDVCTIYHKAYGGTMEGSGLGDLFDSLVQHLTNEDAIFLQKWNKLIDLEAKELEIAKKQIWSSHILMNDQNSGCLSSLVLDTSQNVSQTGFSKGNPFVYRFVHQDSPSQSSPGSSKFNCTFRSGDYVILSTVPGHLPVANGILVDVGSFHVSVSFSKRLRLPGSAPNSGGQDLSKHAWRIDKDENMTSFAIMRFNLVQLFLPSERSAHLRNMIVDLEIPRFDSGCVLSQDPAILYIWSEKSLNDDQRRAILKILTAKDYALILGMPGTGKTSTMVHAVKALLLRGASILLTSYTNSAVDNLLIKLKAQGINFIRIGRSEAVHEEVQEHCLSEMGMHSIEEIKLKLDQTRVIAVTCLGITSPLLNKKQFDVCIMDEAGQITLPVSLGPLMFASKFVLVGDHYQLPPLVQSMEAKENGMAVSLFSRLSEAHPQAISALQSQYRMCAAIMELSNALVYGNRLRCGSPAIENAKLTYRGAASTPEWLSQVLCPERPVIFINTDLLPAFETNDSKTVKNPVEAYIVSEVVNKLVDRGVEGSHIGIITPYNAQANIIREAVSASLEINTIDKYQGRDKDCILLSFVRSTETPGNYNSSLLGDWHRINVAITRAKKKLIMVGSCRTLSTVPLLKLLLEKVDEQSGILNISKKDINMKLELKRCSHKR